MVIFAIVKGVKGSTESNNKEVKMEVIPEKKEEENEICPYCGAVIKASDKKCPSCGAKK